MIFFYYLAQGLQLIYCFMFAYFITRSFGMILLKRKIKDAKESLTSGILLLLSVQAGISLFKTVYFKSWEQLGVCLSLIAMRLFIRNAFDIIFRRTNQKEI